MATIEELERKSAEIAGAEAAALVVLVGGMRELAVRLPDGSKLAALLAEQAKDIEKWAYPRDAALWGGSALRIFNFKLLELVAEQYGHDLEDEEGE